MNVRPHIGSILWGAAALAAMAFGLGYAAFVGDVQRAMQRVAHGSRIADTQCGPIEYAEMGEGPALLLVHGAGGGYDQALDFGLPLAGSGFCVIAMSRFGYLGTPLPPDDASPAAQAMRMPPCSMLSICRMRRFSVRPPVRRRPCNSPCGIATVARRWCWSFPPPSCRVAVARRR